MGTRYGGSVSKNTLKALNSPVYQMDRAHNRDYITKNELYRTVSKVANIVTVLNRATAKEKTV
jgi:hypothetical protein